MFVTCSISAVYSNGSLPVQKALSRCTHAVVSGPPDIRCSSPGSLYVFYFNRFYLQIVELEKKTCSNQQAQNSEALGRALQVLPYSSSARNTLFYLAQSRRKHSIQLRGTCGCNKTGLERITYCPF